MPPRPRKPPSPKPREFDFGGKVRDLAASLGGWSAATSELAAGQSLAARPSADGNEPPPNPKPGDAWTDPLGLTFCWCPPGKFTMGIGDASDPQTRDSPKVPAEISEGFWMQKYEFTLADYQRIRGRSFASNDILIPHGNRPLTAVKGPTALDLGPKTVAEAARKAGAMPDGWEYRLPTEAEWEFACRAGEPGAYSFGDSVQDLVTLRKLRGRGAAREDDSCHYAADFADDLTGVGPAPVGATPQIPGGCTTCMAM
ncbi:MAG: SUMF1/EgtB/PvdO family nonheme iron enzyme [Verrucomicrobiales bacterium]